jgi:hypothetical protein
MATAVITHTLNQGTANYEHLTPQQQTLLDQIWEQADSTIDAGIYNTLMTAAAQLTGIHTSHDGQPINVVRCACEWCDTCPVILDASLPGLRPAGTNDGYNLPLLQCPRCADHHPADHED